MIGLAMIVAAAQAPVQLAGNDEARWRMFVRASLESPAAPPRPNPRMRQIEDALHGLTDHARPTAMTKGPTGL